MGPGDWRVDAADQAAVGPGDDVLSASDFSECARSPRSGVAIRHGVRLLTKNDVGKTIEEARDNLRDPLELFIESASPDEVKQRLRSEVFVTQIEVAVG